MIVIHFSSKTKFSHFSFELVFIIWLTFKSLLHYFAIWYLYALMIFYIVIIFFITAVIYCIICHFIILLFDLSFSCFSVFACLMFKVRYKYSLLLLLLLVVIVVLEEECNSCSFKSAHHNIFEVFIYNNCP